MEEDLIDDDFVVMMHEIDVYYFKFVVSLQCVRNSSFNECVGRSGRSC